MYQFSCEAYGKNIAAGSKFASETLPALNKLLEAEKLSGLYVLRRRRPMVRRARHKKKRTDLRQCALIRIS